MARLLSVPRQFQNIASIRCTGVFGDPDNSNDGVNINSVDYSPTSTDFTIATWVYPDISLSAGWYNMTVYSQTNGTGTGRSWLVIPNSGVNRNKWSSALGNLSLTSGISVKSMQWQFVMITYVLSTGTFSFYVDDQIGNVYTGANLEDATGNHRYGVNRDETAITPIRGVRCLNGWLGPMWNFKRALTAAEGNTLRNFGFISDRTQLQCEFLMKQSSGDVVDSSGNGNHGTLYYNAAWDTNKAKFPVRTLSGSRTLSTSRLLSV